MKRERNTLIMQSKNTHLLMRVFFNGTMGNNLKRKQFHFYAVCGIVQINDYTTDTRSVGCIFFVVM